MLFTITLAKMWVKYHQTYAGRSYFFPGSCSKQDNLYENSNEDNNMGCHSERWSITRWPATAGSATAAVMYSLSRLSITSPINLPQGVLHSYRVQVPTYNYSRASQITEYRAFFVGSGCAPSDATTAARRSVAPALVLFLGIFLNKCKTMICFYRLHLNAEHGFGGCIGNVNFFPHGSSV